MADEIAIRQTADSICDSRNEAMRLYQQAHALIEQANAVAKEATATVTYGTPSRKTMRQIGQKGFVDALQADLDRNVWRHIFCVTGLGDLLDSKRLTEFEATLKDAPPEISVETVVATALGLSARAGEMFAESVYDLFSELKRSFKSHDGFGFGSRLIFSRIMEGGYLHHYGERRILDLQRAVYLVGGDEPPERNGGIVGLIRTHQRDHRDETGNLANELFRVKWYKNGNLHIHILDDERISALNQILAASDELGSDR